MNTDERSAASTGADTERHGPNDLNPTSAPALPLPIQRLGSAMEGLPELKQLLCDIGMSLADREYVANRWASEVEALRQRPGAQAAVKTTGKADSPLATPAAQTAAEGLARVCIAMADELGCPAGDDGEDMLNALRKLKALAATPAGERPPQAEPMTDEREAFDAFVRRTSPDAWEAEIVLAWEAWQTARERPGAQAPSTAERDVEVLIAEGLKRHGYRQGTKECIAFFRGASYADETPLPAAGSGALIDALREAEAGLEFAGADRVEVGGFVPAPTKALAIVRGALRLAAPSTGGAETAAEEIEVGRLVLPAIEDGEYGDPEIDAFMGRIDAVQRRVQASGRVDLPVFVRLPASSAPAQAVKTAGVREALRPISEAEVLESCNDAFMFPIPEAMAGMRRALNRFLHRRAAALQSPAASPASKAEQTPTRLARAGLTKL